MILEELIRLPGVPLVWQVAKALGLGNTSQRALDLTPSQHQDLNQIALMGFVRQTFLPWLRHITQPLTNRSIIETVLGTGLGWDWRNSLLGVPPGSWIDWWIFAGLSFPHTWTEVVGCRFLPRKTIELWMCKLKHERIGFSLWEKCHNHQRDRPNTLSIITMKARGSNSFKTSINPNEYS